MLCFNNTDYEFNVQEEQFTALLKKAKGKLPTQLYLPFVIDGFQFSLDELPKFMTKGFI